jgi:hypothetical protein
MRPKLRSASVAHPAGCKTRPWLSPVRAAAQFTRRSGDDHATIAFSPSAPPAGRTGRPDTVSRGQGASPQFPLRGRTMVSPASVSSPLPPPAPSPRRRHPRRACFRRGQGSERRLFGRHSRSASRQSALSDRSGRSSLRDRCFILRSRLWFAHARAGCKKHFISWVRAGIVATLGRPDDRAFGDTSTRVLCGCKADIPTYGCTIQSLVQNP